MDTPEAVPTFHPTIMREACHWLVTGTHGGEIIKVALANSCAQRVWGAVHSVRDRFPKPVRTGELAFIARMGPSVFRRQFKALTSMTSLQYRKQLRLLEARRPTVSDAANVAACPERRRSAT